MSAGPQGTTRMIERPGARLALHDRGAGTPLLLQHGLCGSAAALAEIADAVPRLRMLTLDCRGHGASEAGDAADFTIARFADDVAAAIEATGLAPLAVGGVSMGAAIATRLAVVRPELVSALVLVRPAWVTEAAPANLAANIEVGELLLAHPPAAARALFEASATAATLAREAPDNLASLAGFFGRARRHVTAALLTRISRDGPGIAAADLGRIAVPTLVVGTTRDLVHPVAAAEALAAAIPGARLVIVPPRADDRARHFGELGAAIRAFLDTAQPEPSR